MRYAGRSGWSGFWWRRLWCLTRLGLLAAVLLACSGATAAELAVTFFDIGQGDSALVVSPTGKRVLIDGGPPEAGDRLLAALGRRHVDLIDLVVLTHPHADHLGGLKKVVGALPVRMFLDSGYNSTSPGYVGLLSLLGSRGVVVKQATAGRQIDLGGGALLTLLGPPVPWLTRTRSDVNANSVVARLAWKSRTALFTGDAEPETERWLLSRQPGEGAGAGGESLQAELLKVAHHGGKYSSTAPFLRAVAPQLAVISVGAGNDYGHPTAEALGRLAAAGARVLRTDQDGEVTLRSHDGQPWQLEKSAADPVVNSAAAVLPPVSAPAVPRASAPGVPPASSASAPPAVTGSVGYVASSRSAVFHRSDCTGAQRIVAANQLRFATRQAALASGRRPAEDCHP